MQWRCIRAFGHHKPAHADEDGNRVEADTVELPDGAQADPHHYEPVNPPAAPDPTPDPATTPAPTPDAGPSMAEAAALLGKEGTQP